MIEAIFFLSYSLALSFIFEVWVGFMAAMEMVVIVLVCCDIRGCMLSSFASSSPSAASSLLSFC